MLNYELKIYSTDNDIVGSNSDNKILTLKNEMEELVSIGREGIKTKYGLNNNITPTCIIIHDNKRNITIYRQFIDNL